MTLETPRVLAIVRHGETDWNLAKKIQGRTEVPLNETGKTQASAAGGLLAAYEDGAWQRLASSPLGRARETATIIGSALGLTDLHIEEDLIERDFGPAEGTLFDTLPAHASQLEIPGAEPRVELATRAAAAFERLLREGSRTVAVAHGALIRAGLSLLSGTEIPRIQNGEVWVLTQEASEAPIKLHNLGVAHPAA